MMASEKNKLLGGFFWKFAERVSSQGVSFVLSVILARLLVPQEYGLVAMINIFIVFANVFVTSGFTASLIQKKDADDLDFSTIFYCTLTASILVYAIIYVCAPYIARFYNMPDLCLLTRVYALSLIITSYQTVQQAYISRHMLFKKTFVATFIGTLLSGLTGVVMAYNGFGVWALVAQYISNIVINMLVLMYIIPWRAKLLFSAERARSLMGYGSKIILSDIVNTIVHEIRQLLIGKYYTPADLALYNRGNHIPNLVNGNLETALSSVLFPAMSNHSNDVPRVRQMLRRSIQTSSYLVFVLMTMLAVVSEPLIRILLTEKWIACVPYMQIICVSRAIGMISRLNIQGIKAVGRSDEILRMEVFKKPAFLLLVLISVKISVMTIALTMPIYAIYAVLVNARPSKKLLGYMYREQFEDLIPAMTLSLIILVCTIPVGFISMNSFLLIIIQLTIGLVVCICCSIWFRMKSYFYLKSLAIEIYRKKIQR